MKSSLGKLKKFAFQKNDGKERRELQLPAKLDELAQASQEMQEMRNCYDSLLSAAAATANSAYEFSESLREMGACLLEKTALYNDEESGKALLMLGNVQFELQKLIDRYRSHVFVTITNPSESLLSELQTVEEMKQQCDEKRSVYEYMMAQQKEKGRSKGSKGESFTLQQLHTAHNEYEEEATLCVFRLKSLKEGQSRSLLTQAARHHTAQLNFFRKGVKSLEDVEPQVKFIAEKHHIEYHLNGLDDDDIDDGDGDGDDDGVGETYDSKGDGEISFDYRHQKPGPEAVSASRNSMELDQEDQTFPKASTAENTEASVERSPTNLQTLKLDSRASSYSAPLFSEKKFDPAEKIRKMRSSYSQKFHTYVLPTPVDAKISMSSKTSSSCHHPLPANPIEYPHRHSASLENLMQKREPRDGSPAASISKVDPLYNDRNNNEGSTTLPPPPIDGRSLQQNDTSSSDHKKSKRQAFSGPLGGRPQSMKPGLSQSGPIIPHENLKMTSSSISQMAAQSSHFKKSPNASPPKMSQLHELPRPPKTDATKSARLNVSLGHSAQLVPRNSELPVTNKSSVAPNVPTPLPVPPLTVPRSFSIPSSRERAMALYPNKLLESPQRPEKTEKINSPPLSPVYLVGSKAVAPANGVGNQSGER